MLILISGKALLSFPIRIISILSSLSLSMFLVIHSLSKQMQSKVCQKQINLQFYILHTSECPQHRRNLNERFYNIDQRLHLQCKMNWSKDRQSPVECQIGLETTQNWNYIPKFSLCLKCGKSEKIFSSTNQEPQPQPRVPGLFLHLAQKCSPDGHSMGTQICSYSQPGPGKERLPA